MCFQGPLNLQGFTLANSLVSKFTCYLPTPLKHSLPGHLLTLLMEANGLYSSDPLRLCSLVPKVVDIALELLVLA